MKGKWGRGKGSGEKEGEGIKGRVIFYSWYLVEMFFRVSKILKILLFINKFYDGKILEDIFYLRVKWF